MINMNKPTVTDYTKYATTKEELERLRVCNNIIKALNDSPTQECYHYRNR